MGRVLTPAGAPLGTCFQLAPSVIATAWHVAREAVSLGDGGPLRLDALAEGADNPVRTAEIVREDRARDLAVLRAESAFAGSVRLLRPAASVNRAEPLVIVGHAELREAAGAPRPRSLEALGTWQGIVTRTDDVLLGRITAPDVLRGMSGAPVRRRRDDAVVGVVSGRYNSTDGWLEHSVWVARTEDLRALCAGLADLDGGGPWAEFAAAAGAVAAAEAADAALRRGGPGASDGAPEAAVAPPLTPSPGADPPGPEAAEASGTRGGPAADDGEGGLLGWLRDLF
ncbi:trypsin-like peptidase domain-containing protein [Streptomonospora nanhaiensis]|uniref:Serine protease n=1 Tax=Streptomonospora nanhaiensis TaxID=1323731 RepID=A0A853BMC4_9ACTN|nr:serine protease [Streptomonospora nanhaiensis]MBV2366644.1 serine protease [Streptomonospora nanhaiensis]NYI95855.1 hypothetical protein [Streptomonospora nanhaiensis]